MAEQSFSETAPFVSYLADFLQNQDPLSPNQTADLTTLYAKNQWLVLRRVFFDSQGYQKREQHLLINLQTGEIFLAGDDDPEHIGHNFFWDETAKNFYDGNPFCRKPRQPFTAERVADLISSQELSIPAALLPPASSPSSAGERPPTQTTSS